MKKRFGFAALLLMIAALLPGLVLAGGYNLAGVGAKALAMSGAYRGIADDWSAMYWNPGGLAGQGTGVYLEAKSLFPIVWMTPDVPSYVSGYPDYELYANGVELTSRAKAYPAGALAITYGLNERTTLGFSVFAPSALGTIWEGLFQGPVYGYNNTTPYPAEAWKSDMKVIDIHPTFAYKLTEKIGVGVGLSFQYGDVLLRSPTVISSGAPMPYNLFYVSGELDGTGWGVGANLGVLADVTDRFHVGLSWRSPVTIALEGNVNQTLILPKNDVIYAMNIAEGDTASATLFQGGSLSSSPDATADLTIPMDFGFGLAYDVNERFQLAADLIWTNWSAVERIDVKLDGLSPTGDPAEDTEILMDYEDTFRFNLGANYVLIPEKGLELRVGYYYDPTPIPDGSLRPSISDVADKHNVSLGGKYNLSENISFEFYWEHLFSGERTVEAGDLNGDGEFDNLPGTYKMQVDTFGFQFGFRF